MTLFLGACTEQQTAFKAGDIDVLINTVAGKLLGGEISDALRSELAGLLINIPANDASLRAAETIYLVVTSPEYALQM